MREIKFRAWDTDNNLFVICEDHQIRQINNDYAGLGNRYVYQQYTGLKDKNGKDIYEFMEINHKWRVVYNFNRYILQSISNSDIFVEIIENEEYEITGEYSPLA